MEIKLQPGRYVVAVSGGVDSIVLLDMLAKTKEHDLIVAHFNHGIRSDSNEDEALVKLAAKHYQLPFESAQVGLGANASEAEARTARYEFLNSVKERYQADAIVTAHHQDDLIETAILNILRGTGPRGLVAISQNRNVKRPLLEYTKEDLYSYACKNGLKWREDTTNSDEIYLRNYVRKYLTPKLSDERKQEIIENIDKVAKNQTEQESLIAILSHNNLKDSEVKRAFITSLPNSVAGEIVAGWLRKKGVADIDKQLVYRVNVLVRTGLPGSRHSLRKGADLYLTKTDAKLRISN
jgi:tRNA(Ile)-lysidine synthetase-like protein